MPGLALAFVLLWLVLLFGLRAWLQWVRTGSTGLKGIQARVGSLPWLAGVGVVVGFVLTFLAPVAALLGWPGGELLFESNGWHALGGALALGGTAGVLLAQLEMGDSWRVGVDVGESTELVTQGLFARVRNPIYSFMGLQAIGLVLLVPNLVALAALIASVAGVELHVRLVEEPHLVRTHGAAYREYAARVGRFVPWLGRRRIPA